MSAERLRELTGPSVSGDPASLEQLDGEARREAADIVAGLSGQPGGGPGSGQPGGGGSSDPNRALDLPALNLPVVVWIVIGLLVAGLLAWLAIWLYRGRSGPGRTTTEKAGTERSRLEQLALEAERAGDHARAVRLRYRAGVERLSGAGVEGIRESATAKQIAAHLAPNPFTELDSVHDSVAYGGAPAGPDDSRAAREQWAEVVRAERG